MRKTIKWIKESANSFTHTLTSIHRCIRFPFLYPRHVMFGKHYVWWFAIEFHNKHWNDAYSMVGHFDGYKVKNYWWAFWVWFFDFIHDYPMQLLHCIPTWTYYDWIPKGWRDAFGEQMCEEFKRVLVENDYLYKYRIDDVKEKYGSLRIYDSGSPNGCMFPIINKYEKLSETTCIVCGKPAHWITGGWICPYCDEHIGNRFAYYEIIRDENGNVKEYLDLSEKIDGK